MVKALVVMEAGQEPEVVDVILPSVGTDDVRVRIAAAGVCHSDLSMVNGTISPRFPVVLGHEASGVIVEIGSQVTDVAVGDRVVLNWASPCRSCWFCLHAEPWLCKRVEGVVSTPGGTLADGTEVNLSLGVGAFAEETVVPRRSVVPLPDDVGDDIGAVMGCAVLTGMGAVRNTADVRSGESVVVFGLGGIGLSAIAGAKLAGATTIIAVDISPDKEESARAMGATDFLVSDASVPKAVRKLTEGRGADHALECVGKPVTIRAAWSSVRRGGTCTVVGVGRITDEVTFNAMEIYHFARTLTSSVFGSCDPERDIPVLAGHVRSGAADLGGLISHRTDLHGVPEAFARMQAGEGARTLLQLA
jgi:S-(hydroxymethyl)glutathione dehydrogenase / alcohol dehydrogenase